MDGNGFVDDVHGIGYDLECNKTPVPMLSIGDSEARRSDLEDMIKGFTDLQANVDSPEATAIKKQISELNPDEVKGFLEELTLYAHYAHGTHVAGIMIEGNPYARILNSRLTADHRMIPEPMTMELAEKLAKS